MNHTNIIDMNHQQFVNGNINDLISVNSQSLGPVIRKLLDSQFFTKLEETKESNEEFGNESFSEFSDIGMVYYYVHNPKNLDSKKNRNDDTKKEYFRELLQLYKNLIVYSSEFEIYIDTNSDSIFKTLKPTHIRRYQEWLINAPLGKGNNTYSWATITRKNVIIKGFFKWLYNSKYISTPLHEHFKSSSVNDQDRPDRALTDIEVKQILDYHKNHVINFALLYTLATTGLRIREIANAKWGNITYDPELGHYWLKVVTKGKKERDVLIFEDVFDSMVAFRKVRRLNIELDPGDEGTIFVTNTGKAYTYKYLSDQVTRIILQTKLPFLKYKNNGRITPHFYRHYFANFSLRQGVDVYHIKETLGHSKLETTILYLKNEESKKNNAALQWKKNIY
ncbi:site-specific integrase [Bacillus sp. SM2101]|uniref:tyrosine-type recombinase/integrase n=1 Tax=Bacillus sp. SM2101 TaxID=2805366 RepID=UPI001BDE3560|nr:site-specific integrase [Bacillus sp. SM2101]